MKNCLILFLLAFSLLTSCTTQLVVQNPNINIKVNGRSVGKGTAEISRMGSPKKIVITADYEGREVGSLTVKRKFDLVSLLVTVYSYGTGIFFSWRFPETIFIPTETITPKEEPKEDIWDLPPGTKW